MNDRVVRVGNCHELVGKAKVQMALVKVSVPVVAGVVPGQVHLAPFAVDLYGVQVCPLPVMRPLAMPAASRSLE